MPEFWVLLASRVPRSAAVCGKSFVFRFLPIRKGLVLIFGFWSILSTVVVAPTNLFCTTCSVLLVSVTRIVEESAGEVTRIVEESAGGGLPE